MMIILEDLLHRQRPAIHWRMDFFFSFLRRRKRMWEGLCYSSASCKIASPEAGTLAMEMERIRFGLSRG